MTSTSGVGWICRGNLGHEGERGPDVAGVCPVSEGRRGSLPGCLKAPTAAEQLVCLVAVKELKFSCRN